MKQDLALCSLQGPLYIQRHIRVICEKYRKRSALPTVSLGRLGGSDAYHTKQPLRQSIFLETKRDFS